METYKNKGAGWWVWLMAFIAVMALVAACCWYTAGHN